MSQFIILFLQIQWWPAKIIQNNNNINLQSSSA
jgi:hypothetical protein